LENKIIHEIHLLDSLLLEDAGADHIQQSCQ
jgi:hypothetical protein